MVKLFSNEVAVITLLPGVVLGFMLSSSQNVTVGDQVRMTCETDMDRPVLWYYHQPGVIRELIADGTKIFGGHSVPYRMEVPQSGVYTLVIDRIMMNNSGIYECVEGKGYGPGRGSLTVTVSRKVFSVSESMRVTVGSGAVFTCTSGIDDPPNWLFYGPEAILGVPVYVSSNYGRIVNGFHKKSFTFITVGYDVFNLVIKRATVDLSGEYECVEDAGFGPGRGKVKLMVECRISSIQTVNVGENAIIACDTGTNDTIKWRFKPSSGSNQEFIDVDDPDRFQQLTTSSVGDHRLVIGNVQRSDAGYYECAVDSGLEISSVAQLIVEDNGVPVRNVAINLGRSIIFPIPVQLFSDTEVIFCGTEQSQRCCVLYSHNSSNADCNNRVEDVSIRDERVLRIRNVKLSDAGFYYWKNDDGFGERLVVVKLNVYNTDVNYGTAPTTVTTTVTAPGDTAHDDQFIVIIAVSAVGGCIICGLIIYLLWMIVGSCKPHRDETHGIKQDNLEVLHFITQRESA